ncbi:Rab family, other [Strigomonas culicis]|uniref:Rab family, other n=1 Tax=Strigomonas culicis TaxID=28005 RepID=S9UXX3_9TRYP|nr:Rab family, other [Strigomonas culicis]EPY33688.1 Rab family, other [Strigomonas culicis]|eukprot:EPY27460.1 Rab family, other [Strigomonas culicis]
MSHKYIFKYIIIGDMSVGKSSLMQRFTQQRFRKGLPHTIGVEFGTTIVDVNGEYIKLQVWDTAGQERFRSVTRGYYRGAAAALIVYDVSRRGTFSHISTWLQDARANTNPQTVMILIGNKSDLEDDREVSFEEATQFAEENHMLFLECSALSGSNVEEAFLAAAHKIHEKVVSGSLSATDPESGVQLHAAALGTGGGATAAAAASGGGGAGSSGAADGARGHIANLSNAPNPNANNAESSSCC